MKKPMSRALVLFAAGAVLFAVLGSLLTEPDTASAAGILPFFYQTVPAALGVLAGLPVGGVGGVLFCLLAAAFFLYAAWLLYKALAGAEGAPLGWVVSLCGLYVTSVGGVMVSPEQAGVFLSRGFLYTVFLIAFFLGVVYIARGVGSFEQKLGPRLAALCCLLSLTAGLAALSGAIVYLDIARWLVPPSIVTGLCARLAAKLQPGAGALLCALLLQAALALLAVVGYRSWLKGEDGSLEDMLLEEKKGAHALLGKRILSAALLLMLWFNSSYTDGYVFPVALKNWLLIVIFVLVVTQGSWKKLLAAVGMFTGVQALTSCLRIFYPVFNNSMAAILEQTAPASQWASGLVRGLLGGQDTELFSMMLVALAVLVCTVLLNIPQLRDLFKLEHECWFEIPLAGSGAVLLALFGVLLRSTPMTGLPGLAAVTEGAAYLLLCLGACVYAAAFLLSIIHRRRCGMHLYTLLIFALLCPVYCVFAQAVSLGALVIVVPLVLGIGACGTLAASVKRGLSKGERKWLNEMEHERQVERVVERVVEEDISMGAARAATEDIARDMVQKDRAIRNE